MSSDCDYDDGYSAGRSASAYLHDEIEGLGFQLAQQAETIEGLGFQLAQQAETIEDLEIEVERLNALIKTLKRRNTPLRLKAKRV